MTAPVLSVCMTISEEKQTKLGHDRGDPIRYTVKAGLYGELTVDAYLSQSVVEQARNAGELQEMLHGFISRQIAQDVTEKIMSRLERIGAV